MTTVALLPGAPDVNSSGSSLTVISSAGGPAPPDDTLALFPADAGRLLVQLVRSWLPGRPGRNCPARRPGG
jgi:hypothetical protein